MELIIILGLILSVNARLNWNTPDHKHTFDLNLFEEVLDEELCHEQMQYLVNNDTSLRLRFLDAGIRFPRGIFEGNVNDLGNYYQCLAINEQTAASTIEGKYCLIHVPLEQELNLPSLPELPELPEIPWPILPINPKMSRMNGDLVEKMTSYRRLQRGVQAVLGGGEVSRVSEASELSGLNLLLAVCIPKSCTTQQAFSEYTINMTALGLKHDDVYCRLPNDKQWVAADTVAICLLSFLGFLLIASTMYDLHYTVVRGYDPKRVNKLYQSFSVYTNTRRLVTYNPVPGAIECLDGVRSMAMMWVIVGHTYVNQVSELLANPLDIFTWISSPQAIWVTLGPITVDTFFMLSGLLLVYTSAGKLSRSKLFKNLHMFYLNRLLRMFPALAAWVLIQASLLNRISDGPHWTLVMTQTHNCRLYWWSTLLHVQNWVNPAHMCLAHSWYLAIDVQLFIISPLILFWILGGKKVTSWVAMVTALILSLVGATVYNFILEFQSGPVMPSRALEDQIYYLTDYYVNTLTRSSPYFIGMIYGYIFHLNRKQRMIISKLHVAILWACAISILATITYVAYPIMQFDWDNQIVDNLINSFMRPAWALAVGWIVLACHHGYGGPINWILSLQCFKVLSRLSYAMYIVHYPLIFVVNASNIYPGYFSPKDSIFKFLADFTLAAIVAYMLTLLVDSPCSTLIKYFMGGGRRPPPKSGKVAEGNLPSNGITNKAYVNEETKNSSL